MQMSTIPLPIRSLAASIVLLAIALFAILAHPARGETPVVVPVESATATAATAASVPAEALPVAAGPSEAASSAEPGVAASESAPRPTPVTHPSPESEEAIPASTGSGSGASVVSAVEKRVADVVSGATSGKATQQVKAAVEETTSAAAAPLKSAVEAHVQPVVDEVVKSASTTTERLPDELAPALSQNAPSPDLSHPSHAESALQIRAEGQAPLPGPVPQIGDEGPSRTFENAVPLETRPVAGWIDGLNLRELFAAPASPDPQADRGLLERSSIDPVGATAGSHAPPSEAPGQHPSPSGPGPVSGLSTNAAPGPGGGNFFVPIAALLALLALAAPAISRRAKEALVAPVPSRFVCALERPG